MTKYVLTLALAADLQSVVIMKKNRGPKLVANRFNFPGGKVEAGESLAEAASRELEEECGLRAEARELSYLGCQRFPGAELHVFVAVLPSVEGAVSMTDEPVSVANVACLRTAAQVQPDVFSPDFMVYLEKALVVAGT